MENRQAAEEGLDLFTGLALNNEIIIPEYPKHTLNRDMEKHNILDEKKAIKHGVSVFTCTNRPQFMEQVFKNYLQQVYLPRELIIVLNNNLMSLKEWQNRAGKYDDIHVFQLDEKISLGECTNYAIEKSNFDYVAKFDDDDYYAPHYLIDMMAAFNYTEADIIGKTSRFIYFKSKSVLGLYCPYPEFSYANYVVGATMVLRKDIWREIHFLDITAGEDTLFQQECEKCGYKIFATDRYNYVTIRHTDLHRHTFQLNDETYLSYCKAVIPTDNFIPIISR